MWALRLNYPYDLEWMEGDARQRVAANPRPALYAAPSFRLSPHLPPGCRWWGCLVVCLGSPRGSGGPYPSLEPHGVRWDGLCDAPARRALARSGAAACFMGCYTRSGAFYDLARPDGLLVGLLVWSLLIAGSAPRSGCPQRPPLVRGVPYETQRCGARRPDPLSLWARGGAASAGRFALASVLSALGCTVVLQWVTEGHFLTYLLVVPGSHPSWVLALCPAFPSSCACASVAHDVRCRVALHAGQALRLPRWAWLGCAQLQAQPAAWVRYWPPAKGVPMPPELAVVLSVACLATGLAVVLVHGAL